LVIARRARWQRIAGVGMAGIAVVLGGAGVARGHSLPDVPSDRPGNFADAAYSTLIISGLVAWVVAIVLLHSGWRAAHGPSALLWWATVSLVLSPLALWGSLALIRLTEGLLPVAVAGILFVAAPVSLVVGVACLVLLFRYRAA